MLLGIFSVVPPTEPCAPRSAQPVKVSSRDFSWGKGGWCVWLTTYHTCSAETSRKFGALTYQKPLGTPRPVAGHLYFTFTLLFKRTAHWRVFCSPVIIYEVKQETWLKNIKLKNSIFFCSSGIFPSRKCRQSSVLMKSNGMVVAYSLTDITRMSGKKTIQCCSKIHLPIPPNFLTISFADISYWYYPPHTSYLALAACLSCRNWEGGLKGKNFAKSKTSIII